MDNNQIKSVLGRKGAEARVTEDCLSPDRLAAYLDGGLKGADKSVATEHVADCDYCLGRLAAVCQGEEETAVSGLPAEVRERALGLVLPTPGRRFLNAPRWAAAAVLVLALGAVFVQFGQSPGGNRDTDVRQTRYVESQAQQPRLLAPEAGSAILPLEQVFRWTEVPGSLFYDVRLISLDGDLLLRERVEGTRWLIPEDLGLVPGEEYYLRVDAYLNDAKYLSSEHIDFTVEAAR